MPNPLIERIEKRLAELNLTPRAASLRVSTNADLIRGILRAGDEANPTQETIDKVATVLGVSREWLLGNDDKPPPPAGDVRFAPDIRLPSWNTMPKDVPVWGTAAGSLIDHNIEGFHLFSGEPIDRVRRPPALANVPDAYAIYVSGDSMYPMHPPGELRFVHPHRPAAAGDTVIVSTRHWETDPGQGYIKLYRRRKGDMIVLEQLNPGATIEIPVKYVVSVHRVLNMNELFGV
ncbi:MAG: XRE family transcriptional regulator [Devosia nanyangense]|uniref:XRE family transcriptional regulator n=1 Tax=Devosia nanyangense TaxID=1228055 RepID=A0A933L1L6_9HYPH|nr:XRE family transcriptional regulator [Devosia nanyangense]